MLTAIACLLPRLLLVAADAGPQAVVSVEAVRVDDVQARGPVTAHEIAEKLDGRAAELAACLGRSGWVAGKYWLKWSIDEQGVAHASDGADALDLCLVECIAFPRFSGRAASTQVTQPFVMTSNWRADPVVRGVRDAVARLDASLDGGVALESCRLFVGPEPLGSTTFVAARRVALPAVTRLVLETATSGQTDDVASTQTRTEYRDPAGRVIFRYRQRVETRAMAPVRSEERTYYQAGRPYLFASRSGPAADPKSFDEAVRREPAPALDSIDQAWAVFGGPAGHCDGLRALFEAGEPVKRAELKGRFKGLVVFGEVPPEL